MNSLQFIKVEPINMTRYEGMALLNIYSLLLLNRISLKEGAKSSSPKRLKKSFQTI